MADDWFRNRDWSPAISEAFEAKLGRVRRKEQYLRIQACTLAAAHPVVALELLDRYFRLPDQFDRAQGHVDQATALKALGRYEEAVDAYECALAREQEFPNLQTQAFLQLPVLVATRRMRARFERALAVLGLHRSRLLFPRDVFLWHASHALIDSAMGRADTAAEHARQALAAANIRDSGYRYHSDAGLVTSEDESTVDALRDIISPHDKT